MGLLCKTIVKSYGEGPWHTLSFEITCVKGLTHWEVWERRLWWKDNRQNLEPNMAIERGDWGRDEVKRLLHHSKLYAPCLLAYEETKDQSIIHSLYHQIHD